MTATVFVLVGAGLALMAWTVVGSRRQQTRRLAELLEAPAVVSKREHEPEQEPDAPSALAERAVGLAGKVVDRFDAHRRLADALERARIPLRPGELVVIAGAASVTLSALLYGIFGTLVFAVAGLALGPVTAWFTVRRRIARRRRAFEGQLPGALTLIASSLAAGHTFLRAIQMMTDEAEPPISEEFSRVVSETRLGDPVVEALGRMATRLGIRDLDWVVQAIRIQQSVGGRLADLLHTLADFIRARDEVRREVLVLTAEGRISAYVLGALPVFLLVAIQIMNPSYMQPMYSGMGLVALILSGASVAFGTALIFRMSKIDI